MESTYQRLAVRFKLPRPFCGKAPCPNGCEKDTFVRDFHRTLSLLGQAFQDGKEHYTHARLVAYLERKGSMEFWEPVWKSAKTPTRNSPASVLAGNLDRCQTCRRCVACGNRLSTGKCSHNKLRCDCPFPRRIQGWNKAACEEDIASIDAIQAKLTLLVSQGKLLLDEFHRKYRRCEGMKLACRNKLFAIRMRMQEAEGLPQDSKRTAMGIGKDVLINPARQALRADTAFLKSIGIVP